MIRLDNDLRKLEALLAGAVATTQPVSEVQYRDKRNLIENSKETTSQFATLNGATPVTICSAPGRAIYREVEEVIIRNPDSANVTATVRLNDNGTSYQIAGFVLRPNDQLQYTAAGGWRVMDSLGRLR